METWQGVVFAIIFGGGAIWIAYLTATYEYRQEKDLKARLEEERQPATDPAPEHADPNPTPDYSGEKGWGVFVVVTVIVVMVIVPWFTLPLLTELFGNFFGAFLVLLPMGAAVVLLAHLSNRLWK